MPEDDAMERAAEQEPGRCAIPPVVPLRLECARGPARRMDEDVDLPEVDWPAEPEDWEDSGWQTSELGRCGSHSGMQGPPWMLTSLFVSLGGVQEAARQAGAGGVRPVGGAAVGCSPFASAIRHTCDPQGAAAGRVGGVAGAAFGAASRAASPGVQERPGAAL